MVEQFKARFVKIGPALAENLDQLSTEDIRFRDPISAVTGLVDLRRYFEHFAEVSAGGLRPRVGGELAHAFRPLAPRLSADIMLTHHDESKILIA
jgi:hypothetical protein